MDWTAFWYTALPHFRLFIPTDSNFSYYYLPRNWSGNIADAVENIRGILLEHTFTDNLGVEQVENIYAIQNANFENRLWLMAPCG